MNAVRAKLVPALTALLVACGGASPPPTPSVTSSPPPDETQTIAAAAPSSRSNVPPAPSRVVDTNDAPPPANMPEYIAARHILIQWIGLPKAPVQITRSRDQAYQLALEVLKRVRAGDDFARLAVDYSDEAGSAARGGGIGRFRKGQFVSEFEMAVFRLDVGQTSGIVESSIGFHIIQRTE